MVLTALQSKAANPRGIGIEELFPVPPHKIRRWPKGPNQVGHWGKFFAVVDTLLHAAEPYFPKKSACQGD